MRHINANYAMYFNKKYQRKGPLWTGRYKSYYVLNDDYLYRLLKYIEYNPVDAKISKHIGEYTFTLIHTVLNNKMKVIPCAKDSKILLELNELKEYLQVPLSKKEVKLLHEDQKKVIIKTDYIRIREKSKELNSYFHNKQTLKQRNDNVLLAIQDGYKQSEISKYLSVSPSMISKIFRGIK
jgi:hypothetical protein